MPDITISWVAAILGLVVAIVLILKNLILCIPCFLVQLLVVLLEALPVRYSRCSIKRNTKYYGNRNPCLSSRHVGGCDDGIWCGRINCQRHCTKAWREKAILSLALSTMVITAVGVFIPVAVLIVAPIALSVGKSTGISKLSLLIALSGGGKAGNIISPNPNTIAAANGFDLPLSDVMIAGFIPAVFGLITAVVLANIMRNKGSMVKETDLVEEQTKELLPLKKALIAPVLAIVLLLLNPIGAVLNISFIKSLNIDALYILPFASVVGTIAIGQTKQLAFYASSGLKRVTDTVLILIGAGAIAGLISVSDLSTQIVHLISVMGISGTFLAPISGILMGLAVGSTSTAVILATGSFGPAILDMGTSSLSAAVMVHTGATVIDSVPQGNYFHITAQSMNMTIKERIRVIPYEMCVGGVMTIVATILYGFILN